MHKLTLKSSVGVVVCTMFAMIAGADSTGTYATNDVVWTWKTVDSNSGGIPYRLGTGTASSTAMPTDTELDAALIPWGYMENGSYRVVDAISSYAFKDCKGLTGSLIVPSTVKYISDQAFVRTSITRAIVGATRNGDVLCGKQVFFGCTSLKGVLYKGHGKISMNQHFNGASSLKLVVFGPQIARSDSFNSSFYQVSDCKIFYSASQTSWDDGTDSDWNVNSGNQVIRYGEGEAFDMAFSDTDNSVTIYPMTEEALFNAIEWAPLFKDSLGLDMKIAITERIEISKEVEISESMLQNVTLEAPPWYLTFKVASQIQLDNILDVISVDTPIIIDVADIGKDQIKVRKGRKVAILADSEWTFGRNVYGLVITFK